MRLLEAEKSKSYTIDAINASEEGMGDFLFTLGCFPGEEITIISRMASNLIINVKDARYSIDDDLASAIVVSETEGFRKIV